MGPGHAVDELLEEQAGGEGAAVTVAAVPGHFIRLVQPLLKVAAQITCRFAGLAGVGLDLVLVDVQVHIHLITQGVFCRRNVEPSLIEPEGDHSGNQQKER